MKATDVFTPGRFPAHTFVEDHLVEKKQQLLDTLAAGAMLVSISGPSKSGKTVFVEQILGKQNLIQITGAGVKSADDLWLRVFDIIGTPVAKGESNSTAASGSISGKGSIEGGVLVAKAKAEASVGGAYTSTTTTTTEKAVDYLQMLIKELGGTDFVVFIDDFHYVPRDVQAEAARQIKEGIRNSVKFICASVPYHADDVIRSNTDLRGRVFSIDFDYWKPDVLSKIAYKGFEKLNVSYRQGVVDTFSAEAAGSPQLMQYLCLNACFELGVRETAAEAVDLKQDQNLISAICRRTSLSTDYGSIVEKMKEGPKVRGADRKIYVSKDGWQGDVYKLLAKALSLDPPELTFRYQPLVDRIAATCNGMSPSGSSVTSACYHVAKIVNDAVGERIVEWDAENDVFDIRDPYFLFYLRWSDAVDG